MLIIIDINGAKSSIRGMLSRLLFEIRRGTYVGNISRRSVEQLWGVIVASSPEAAMLLSDGKNEAGIDIKSIGNHRYSTCDWDGIPLVIFKKSKKVNASN